MGSGFRTFQSGEVLTAANVQNYLMDQAVMVFAGTAARSSAIGTANFETGMVAYSTATQLEVYNGANWVVPTKQYVVFKTATATTAYTSATTLTVLTESGTIVAGRRYRIEGKVTVQPSTGNAANHALFVTANATNFGLDSITNTQGANLPATYEGSVVVTASDLGVASGVSTVSFDLKYRDGGNNGGLNTNPDAVVGANSYPQQLIVTDIGPT